MAGEIVDEPRIEISRVQFLVNVRFEFIQGIFLLILIMKLIISSDI